MRLTGLALLIACCVLVAVVTGARRVAAGEDENAAGKFVRARDAGETLIEAALFTRTEFFGAQAIVPYPTLEARNRLAELETKLPNDAGVSLKLSQLDEKLGRFELAQTEIKRYVELRGNDQAALRLLASFFHRRAQFAVEAATLERMMTLAPSNEKANILRELVELARVQKLENYLSPDFYKQIADQNPAIFEIITQEIDKLIEEKDYAAALKAVRGHENHFPAEKDYFVTEEATLLGLMNAEAEAEAVYTRAFDPFWSKELSESFYDFLREHDRFRAYGHELRAELKRNPANFDAAVRLYHYAKYSYDDEESSGILTRLEEARAARKVAWAPVELATCARLLIADGDADAASRFLYTLYVGGELKRESPLRAAILYQLFELLCDARDQRLALTRGDLKFYKDVATADYHPGITGGILSLIFSDADPEAQFEKEEARAVRQFNRAAAYRIFNAYKQEYPTSPELAQMYLDIVRLYTATHEPDIAAATLDEFEKRFEDAKAYPEVALKLADCYVAFGRHDEERALYLRVMNYLGQQQQHRNALEPLLPAATQTAGVHRKPAEALDVYSEPTEVHPAIAAYPSRSNSGINIPNQDDAVATESYASETYSDSGFAYHDYMEQRAAAQSSDSETAQPLRPRVVYGDVLERYVASLAAENRTAEILALYSGEIKKYPSEGALYEQLLQWLGQTNLVEEQLRVYKESLRQFPNALWQDRLARWFLRHQRKTEFESLSRELIEKLDDDEADAYLKKFIDANANAGEKSFDASLYQSLYSVAHERFPHNQDFVQGLLRFHSAHRQWPEWRKLCAEYYFESREVREQFLSQLASRNELRGFLQRARTVNGTNALLDADSSINDSNAIAALPYKLFRADAAAWLANYEEAIDAYRELNRLYPNTPEFSERLINFTRSFGQHNRRFLEEAASVQVTLADAAPASLEYRTRAGEIYAELGDYNRARGEWEKLIELGRGEPDTYLETATIYWDYFQYADALRTLNALRFGAKDQTLYAYQAGAILEAQHQTGAALIEYAKALDEDNADYRRTKRRLLTLFHRPGIEQQFAGAFAKELAHRRVDAQHDPSSLVLGYVELLKDAHLWEQAAVILRREVARSTASQKFLDRARDAFLEANDARGEQAALARLINAARSPRFAISYRLQLIEAFNREGQQRNAASALNELLRQFPTNYGVLSEAADFYWRMGRREESLRILRTGYERGKGKFHYIFGRTLAARELEANRTGDAASVLAQLHVENKLNTSVFHELARLYVHTSNRDALKMIFRETLDAIKAQDVDVREMRAQVADLRGQMIEAFTELNDYEAAIEQHIEIINRDPADEAHVEAAIAYARRYGGTERLLAYYLQTASQAYKNYRWNVVLARLYDAQNDLPNAAQNYRVALQNQPEMPELYDALADVETRLKNYDAALEALNKAAELAGDDPPRIKRIIETLEKAGRHREAETARQRLPQEEPKKQTLADQFAEAAKLRGSEKAQAAAAYRQAFEALLKEPLKHDLKAADITGYVQIVRDEESLDAVLQKLWTLRAELIAETERAGSTQSGKARDVLQTLDGVIPEAVGGVAADKATGDELAAVFQDLRTRIESALRAPDQHGTLSLLQNLSRRAGFGALEEKILLAQASAARASGAFTLYHERLHSLVDFYSARGDYQRIVELLEAKRSSDELRAQFDYSRLIAENARLINDPAKELQALRDYYQQANEQPLTEQTDSLIERYFAALSENGEAGKAELSSCAQRSSPHGIQLINYLLARGERELARQAIENAPLPNAWKLSRNAEASLALRNFDSRDEAYFRDALHYTTVGAAIAQQPPPDAQRELIGDDWFHLAADYGQWLASSGSRSVESRAWLPAMIENRPHDEGEQTKLAAWYLEHKNPQSALTHFQLALEIKPDDSQTIANLGSAYFLSGETSKAEAAWSRLITGHPPALQDCALYLQTLVKHGRSAQARGKLFPAIVAHIEKASSLDGESYGVNKAKEFDKVKPLIRELANSFAADADSFAGDADSQTASSPASPLPPDMEAARAIFFRQLCEALPDNTALPEMLMRESLIAGKERAAFYRLLIERSEGLSSYDCDYDYQAQLHSAWNETKAEEALDHANDFKPAEPTSKRLEWQKEFLRYLLDERATIEARNLIAALEAEVKRRYARPAWLRLAKLQLAIRDRRTTQVDEELRTFVGIKTNERIARIAPPNIERLNDAVAMLRREGRKHEAAELLASAYARALALEQYEASSFIGLARLEFEKNEVALGLRLLQLMVDLGDAETTPQAAAELAALPSIKIHALDDPAIVKPEPHNEIEPHRALSLASETAAAAARFETAIGYRRQLLKLAPDDDTNRLELARLFAANGQSEEAISTLASLIADRNGTRRARWRAVWMSPEIVGKRSELWEMLQQKVLSAGAKDTEMITALKSLELADAYHTDEARALLNSVETTIPTPHLALLRASLERQDHRNESALAAFLKALIADRDGKAAPDFGHNEAWPLEEAIRLYALTGQPRAALKLADSDAALKAAKHGGDNIEQAGATSEVEAAENAPPVEPEQPPAPISSYQTFDERLRQGQTKARTELLGLLSEAAEQTRDFNRALGFEKAKLALLSTPAERRTALSRIDKLLAQGKEEDARKQKQVLRVDRNLIARR